MSALDPIELTRQLIAIDSVNPDLVPGGAGESSIADTLSVLLGRHGFAVHRLELTAGRPSIVAVAAGTGGGRSVMLNGHLDTVSLDGYDGDGLDPFVRDGAIHGRGAYDMKSGIAAAVVAATEVAARPHRGDIVLAMVADEEYGSRGTEEVLERIRTDTAIVVEPSGLDIVTAHRGFVWADVTIHGKAAHGSRRDLGIDAIAAAGTFLTGVASLDVALSRRQPHPLLGTGSVHTSLVRGGAEASTYPDSCTITLERRTLPGEDDASFERELQAILLAARDLNPSLAWTIRTGTARTPFAAHEGSTVVRALSRALEQETGVAPLQRGEPFWTDGALLADAGIDTALVGVDGGGAHAAIEWATRDSILVLTRALTAAVRDLAI